MASMPEGDHGSPGQKPREITSSSYASRSIGFARSGARLPLKRVTARSQLPQKKWTGLHFPRKRAERFEDRLDETQDAPEASHRRCIVRRVLHVFAVARLRRTLD